eukprot:m.96686 g.96686  ORF g.96686 m.96686 type:complete len:332 (+) comp10180_c0_seq1:362-1357(+)
MASMGEPAFFGTLRGTTPPEFVTRILGAQATAGTGPHHREGATASDTHVHGTDAVASTVSTGAPMATPAESASEPDGRDHKKKAMLAAVELPSFRRGSEADVTARTVGGGVGDGGGGTSTQGATTTDSDSDENNEEENGNRLHDSFDARWESPLEQSRNNKPPVRVVMSAAPAPTAPAGTSASAAVVGTGYIPPKVLVLSESTQLDLPAQPTPPRGVTAGTGPNTMSSSFQQLQQRKRVDMDTTTEPPTLAELAAHAASSVSLSAAPRAHAAVNKGDNSADVEANATRDLYASLLGRSDGMALSATAGTTLSASGHVVLPRRKPVRAAAPP